MVTLVLNTVVNAINALKKPAIAAVLLLLMYDPNSALAAPGGRMGGNSFNSRSSASSYSSSSSSSYSKPNTSSSSSSWSSYSEPKRRSTQYYESSSPVGFGRGDGGVYVGPASEVGSSAADGWLLPVLSLVMLIFFARSRSKLDAKPVTAGERTSVLKLQVGLLGMARSLQKDLNRIAETADTSSSEGLRYILSETALALIRHPDDCISAYSSVDFKQSMVDVEKHFNELCIEERGKFDEETLVNVNNIKNKKKSTTSQATSGISNEYIVTTILVAAKGVLKLPTISGIGDLKEALQKLGSIPSSKIKAVEVLWTPQDENDILSEQELLEDYPLLRPL